MSEIELKLQIPKQKKSQILKAIHALQPELIPLHAQYFDTNTFTLAKNYTAIRLRKEGKVWVQTLKGASTNTLQRYELEINRGKTVQAPLLSVQPYKKDQQAKALLGHLIETPDQLVMQFETVVERQFKVLTQNTSKIEICLDLGHVGNKEQHEEICEIEFELVSGSIKDLIGLAKQWVEHYGIWLDVRSKAERGNLISRGEKVSIAPLVSHITITKKMLKKPILAIMLTHYITPLLPCIAAIADQVAEISHYRSAEAALSHLIQIIIVSESTQIFSSPLSHIHNIKQHLSDYILLFELEHSVQPYTCDSFKGLTTKLSRIRAQLAQNIVCKDTTLWLLDLLDISQNQGNLADITAAQFIQQLQQKQTTEFIPTFKHLQPCPITHHDLEFYVHYSALKKDRATKYLTANISLQQTQRLQYLIHSIRMLKTEQSFFLGWLARASLLQKQSCEKRLKNKDLINLGPFKIT